MDLFLDNSFESKSVFLVCEYMGAFLRNTVKAINLNPLTFTVSQKSDVLKMPNPPFLVTDNGEVFTTIASILTSVSESLAAKDLFMGESSSNEESQVLSVLETCSRKSVSDCIEIYNDLLASTTFLAGGHVTVADLVLFTKLYEKIILFADEDKVISNHLFRWYFHIQNLPQVKALLESQNKYLVSFPKCTKAPSKKKKGKK